MYLFLLVLIFIAVFGFLAWRIIAGKVPQRRPEPDVYVCPICNETHCECEKESQPPPA